MPSDTSPPIITSQPYDARVRTGYGVVLEVVARGSGLAYQWIRNGAGLSGATNPRLIFRAAQEADAGIYQVAVTNAHGTVLSHAASLEVIPPLTPIPPARLANLSVRARVGTSDDFVIVGFVLSGSSGKEILLRGVGPALKAFGVEGALERPLLKLLRADGQEIFRNAGWGSTWGDVFTRAGAFPLAPNSHDAAIWLNLDAGAYTAHLRSCGPNGGVALAELYDLNPQGYPGRFTNLSARARTDSGAAALMVGFVVTGSAPLKVLIRGIGPALGDLGVCDVVTHPRLELQRTIDGTPTVLATNDRWDGADALRAAFAQVGAFTLNHDSNDTALIATLPPGAYTAQLASRDGRAGAAMIEVYELP